MVVVQESPCVQCEHCLPVSTNKCRKSPRMEQVLCVRLPLRRHASRFVVQLCCTHMTHLHICVSACGFCTLALAHVACAHVDPIVVLPELAVCTFRGVGVVAAQAGAKRRL